MKKALTGFMSLLSGFTNVIFGSGGGILAVESLKMQGLSQKKSQATAICATLLLSLFSVIYYLYKDYFNLKDALLYIPFGMPGTFVGSYLLRKLPDKLLKKIFALIIIWAGLRAMLK